MSSFKRKNTDSGEEGPNSKRGTKSGGEKISTTPPSPEDSGEEGPNSKGGTKSGGEKISAPPSPEGKEVSSQTGGGPCHCRTSIGFEDYDEFGYKLEASEIAAKGKAWTPCSIHGGLITRAPPSVMIDSKFDSKRLPSRGKIDLSSDFIWEDPGTKKKSR